MQRKRTGARPGPPFRQRARLQEQAGEQVRCLTCERRCLLRSGDLGWCRTRRNDDGLLVTLTYGAVSSLSDNPIEKKPLYHFHPGTVALTAGSWSCNLDCPWCQNWTISKRLPDEPEMEFISPEQFVRTALDHNCQGTSISLNEPTLSLEWACKVLSLARAEGLYNTFVTNGYMTEQALDLLVQSGLDAANVDIKGAAGSVREHCGIDVECVWRNSRRLRERGVWVEVTTLVIPTVNDDEVTLGGIARRLVTEVGDEVPWHVSAYFPAYRFTAPPTPTHVLERAWKIGKEQGLSYVYIGNIPVHPHEHTRCPACGTLLIERAGLSVRRNRLERGHCPECGEKIAGVWGTPLAPRPGSSARPV